MKTSRLIILAICAAVLLACAIPGGSPTPQSAQQEATMVPMQLTPPIREPTSTPNIVSPTPTLSICAKLKQVLGSYADAEKFLSNDGLDNLAANETMWIPAPKPGTTIIYWTPSTGITVDSDIAKIILEESAGTIFEIKKEVIFPFAGTFEEIPEVCSFE